MSPRHEPGPRSDGFGFDPEFTERVTKIALWLYRNYWRVEVDGVTNVPGSGRALLVANHAGIVPYDGAMIRTAIVAEHPQPRHARMLEAGDEAELDEMWEVNVKAPFRLIRLALPHLRRAGHGRIVNIASTDAKRYRDRYRIRRLGRGGFVQVALRTGAPIIPVAVVGSEEVHPVLADLQPLARLLGMPNFPITPTFPWLGLAGLAPLPSKWFIAFGKPIEVAQHGPDAVGDARLVLEISEQVREWIQTTVNQLRPRRQTIFF